MVCCGKTLHLLRAICQFNCEFQFVLIEGMVGELVALIALSDCRWWDRWCWMDFCGVRCFRCMWWLLDVLVLIAREFCSGVMTDSGVCLAEMCSSFQMTSALRLCLCHWIWSTLRFSGGWCWYFLVVCAGVSGDHCMCLCASCCGDLFDIAYHVGGGCSWWWRWQV